MIETKVKIDSKVQEELNHKPQMISVAFMLIGTIGLIVYIILSVVLDPVPTWVDFMLIFAAFLGVGIVQYFVIKKTNEIAAKEDRNSDVRIVFNEDHYAIYETKNGEEIGMKKVFYKDVFKVKETKNYLFIKPSRAVNAFNPVDKNAITLEQLNTIKELLKKDKKRK